MNRKLQMSADIDRNRDLPEGHKVMDTGPVRTERSTPGPFSGTLTCTVSFSKDLIKGLLTEFHRFDLSRLKAQSEALGLLFGTTDATSVRLEHLQPVKVGDDATSTLGICKRLHKALGERMSEIRSSPVQSSALVGWYVVRSGGDTGLLDRDIDVHNTFFRSPRDATVIVRLEAKEHVAVEVYSAKPGVLLSKNDHRAGSWTSANLDGLAEQVDVPLADVDVRPADTDDDELLLNVYRTAKSLDEAEFKGVWESIRRFMARLMPAFRTIPTNNLGTRTNPISRAAWLLGTVLVSLLTYLCANVYLKPLLLRVMAERQTHSEISKPGRPVTQEQVLNFRVNHRGDGAFEVSWNPHSRVIQNALLGTLWMTDRTHILHSINLSADELQSGHVMYMAVSADITFHFKVTDRAGRDTAESVRVLNDARPERTSRFDGLMTSDLPAKAEPNTKPPKHAVDKSAAGFNNPTVASLIKPKPIGSPATGHRQASDDHPSVLPRNDTSKLDFPAMPAGYLQGLVYSLTSSGLPKPQKRPQTSSQVPVTPAVPPPPKLLLSHPGSPNQKPRTQTYNPPRILSKYVPSLPLHAGEPVDAFVSVIAKITDTGKVTEVMLDDADKDMPPYLVDFALSAARKWQFSPATVNGTPVTSSMTIHFHFTPPP